MEKNTIIAFTVTILMGLAAVTFCFLTYQKYLTIKVFQGEQITTNEGKIHVKIDEYFRDDVSIKTVKHIAKTIETELFKGAESEIEHLVKDLVHNNNTHKMKGRMKDDSDSDSDFKYIGLKEGVGYMADQNLDNCGGCTKGPISTKACCIWRAHVWGDKHSWQWVGNQNWSGCNPWIRNSPWKNDWQDTSNCDGPGLNGGEDSCQPAGPSDFPDAPRLDNDGDGGWYEDQEESIFGKNEHMRGYCSQKQVHVSANPEETQIKLNSIPQFRDDGNINVIFYPPKSNK